MKILFINLPYYGHMIPTIGLVQELIKKGCEVTYLMPFDWEEIIAESGAEFYGYDNHKKLSEQIKNAYAVAEKIINNFDFIVYEQFFFLGKHLAEKYNKPVARIFTAPVTNKKLMQEYISSKGPLSIFKHKWITKAFTKDVAKDVSLKTDNWLDEIIYNPPKLNLVYTLREYQPYEKEFPAEQYKFLGASIYERRMENLGLEKGEKPIIYVSLGTVVKGAVFFFQNCIEAFREEDVEVIISVGKEFNMEKLRNVPPNIHIYKSVPQLEVLNISDVFITHGGMNSISEAFVYGVPMVVIPVASDQPVNARCIEKLGVGKKLDYTTIDSKVLKNTVFSILSDVDIRENMVKVQKLIHEAPGNKGGAEIIINHYNESI